MGLLSDANLRRPWRFAQFVLGIPLFAFAITTLLMLGMLVADPAWSLAVLRGISLGFWLLLGFAVWGIHAIERHLRDSPRPIPAPSSADGHKT